MRDKLSMLIERFLRAAEEGQLSRAYDKLTLMILELGRTDNPDQNVSVCLAVLKAIALPAIQEASASTDWLVLMRVPWNKLDECGRVACVAPTWEALVGTRVGTSAIMLCELLTMTLEIPVMASQALSRWPSFTRDVAFAVSGEIAEAAARTPALSQNSDVSEVVSRYWRYRGQG